MGRGISFEEAITVFGDPLGLIVADRRHSEAEERFVLIGESARQRLLVVMFTERGDAIRVMSEGAMVVTIDADLATVFPGAREVNAALRALAGVMKRQRARRPPRRTG